MLKKKKKTKKVKSSSLKKSKKKNKIDIDYRADAERFWKSEAGKNIIADVNGENLQKML